jgi:dTDP-4-dehydrorhamnose 3,5-epimerase
MHFQLPPYGEAKLIRCTRGAIYDVIIDIRSKSASYGEFFGIELTAKDHRALYVPEGFAHGFQTLENDTEVFYQMSRAYRPEAARGIRWNDPVFAIKWPVSEPIVSERDSNHPDFVIAPGACAPQA